MTADTSVPSNWSNSIQANIKNKLLNLLVIDVDETESNSTIAEPVKPLIDHTRQLSHPRLLLAIIFSLLILSPFISLALIPTPSLKHEQYVGTECHVGSEYPDVSCPFGGCLIDSNCTMWKKGMPNWKPPSKKVRWKHSKSETDRRYLLSSDRVHMIPEHKGFHVFSQPEAISCLQGKRIVFSGDSMMRQLFNRMVYWLRGIDHVVEHYYHTHASYTFSHQSDLFELGKFNWSPRVNQSSDILLGYIHEAQNVPWERAIELEADVFIPSTNYHYNKVFHEQMIWGVYEYAMKSRQDTTLYWYATPPKGQHGLSTDGHCLRNGMMRGGIDEINRMSNSSTMKAFVLPSDVFSMSGRFLRNAGGDSHYQCAYLSLYPEPIQSGKLKTPETKDCRDLFNYNLIQVLLNSLCEV